MLKRDSANLDILRTLAVVLVFISHLLEAFGFHRNPLFMLWGVDSAGQFGVRLFFIHTSLVLLMSLARQQADGQPLLAPFYIRRIFRIYPLAIVTVVLVLLLRIPSYFGIGFIWPDAGALWSNLLLTTNVTGAAPVSLPLWSLPFEVDMYVVLPFCFLLGIALRKYFKNGPWLSLAMIAIGLVFWQADKVVAGRLGIGRLFLYSQWFFLGVAAYFYSYRKKLSSHYFLLAFGTVVVVHFAATRLIVSYKAGWVEWLVTVPFAILLLSFEDVEYRPLRLVCHYVAKYSYSVYLIHLPLMWVIFTKLGMLSLFARFLITLCVLPVLSVLFFHAIEQPFIRWGGKLATSAFRRRTAPKTTVVASGYPTP